MDQTLSLIEKTAFLKSVPVLSTIPTEPLAEVASRAHEFHYDSGAAVFKEGDPNRGTFIVVDGMLELRRGAAVVRVLGRGMAFGELWLRENEPHQYTLLALEHTHVLNITRDDVLEAMLEYPEFGVGMARAFALRIHELTSRILDLESTITTLYGALRQHGIDPPELPPTALEPTPEALDMFGVRTGPMAQATRDRPERERP
jgi:CRP-like cAMP-binding protein